MPPRFFRTALLFAFQVVGALTNTWAATLPAAAKRPNILWIVAENIGPDFGCYGHPLVQTPNLDRFAAAGLRYRLAFSTAPVCSASRSAFMTGMYQTTLGAHGSRSHRTPELDDRFHLPQGVRPLTHWLAEAGYFSANVATMDGQRVGTGKVDLNFEVEGPVLRPDEPPRTGGGSVEIESIRHNHHNSVRLFHATEWDTLKARQPFFAQVNLPVVERGAVKDSWAGSQENPWFGRSHPKRIDPAKVEVPPYYPDHPVMRKEWAGYLDAVCDVDTRAGEILQRLEVDGLADDTIVVFFGDNGRLEHRGLHWAYDSGDRVPLIIRWPKNFPPPPQYQAGGVSEHVVSLLDLTATTLWMAGAAKPKGMQSQVILGNNADPPRTFIVGAADRCDGVAKRSRAIRTSRYRYIRNFTPEVTLMQTLSPYKAAKYPAYRLMWELQQEGKLTPPQEALMAARWPDEELFDLERDPYEIRNLASSPDREHQRILRELRATLERWVIETDDLGRFPEDPRIVRWWQLRQRDAFGLPEWFGRKH